MKKTIDERLVNQHGALRESKSDARRTSIIKAAIHSIATKGIHETSLFSIAKEIKSTRSLVTHYFKNVDALIEATIHYVLQVGQEITVASLVNAVTPDDTLKGIVNATFDWFEREPEHASVVELALYYASFDDRYRKLSLAMRNYAESRLLAVLDADPKWKKVSPQKRRERARAIRNYHLGSVVSLYSCTTASERETFQNEVLKTTRLMIE